MRSFLVKQRWNVDVDLIAEGDAAAGYPLAGNNRAGLPGRQKQLAFLVRRLGGGAKQRLAEYDCANIVIQIRLHQHKRFAKTALLGMDLH